MAPRLVAGTFAAVGFALVVVYALINSDLWRSGVSPLIVVMPCYVLAGSAAIYLGSARRLLTFGGLWLAAVGAVSLLLVGNESGLSALGLAVAAGLVFGTLAWLLWMVSSLVILFAIHGGDRPTAHRRTGTL